MQNKYGLLDPRIGEYTFYSTQAEVEDALCQLALSFFMLHTANRPVAFVTVNDDGSEIWYGSEGNVTPNYAQLREQMLAKAEQNRVAYFPVTEV